MQAIMEIAMERYSGPLPHPKILKQYDEIVPGSAERIIAQSEKQTDHRIAMESHVVTSGETNERIGMILGFLLAVLAICLAGFVVWLGQPILGVTIFVAELVVLAGVFVYAKTKRDSELHRRRQDGEE